MREKWQKRVSERTGNRGMGQVRGGCGCMEAGCHGGWAGAVGNGAPAEACICAYGEDGRGGLLEGMWGCKGGAEEVREEGRAGEGWLLRPARGL
eukprot:503401-Pelagomonas_calceolata.AAC.1